MWSVLAVSVLAALVLAGCGSQPAQEIQAAKAAVDAAVADGGEKFAPAETKGASDALNAALEEVKTQDGKFFKNYDKAKEMLAKAKADAETVKAGLAAKKEQAKNEATASLTAASDAVAAAKAALSKAPKGKGAAADIEAMKGDLQGLEAALAEVKPLIDSQDYAAARDKAAGIKSKADAVSTAVSTAMEKMAAAKPGKKK
ncbi:MAG TPA: DUF4398 domain-containing protein [Candidatus Methylomirabilis sp.]|nr:DUF4398 domain-containing protein [Candidatus Methylomirabilis sp.]